MSSGPGLHPHLPMWHPKCHRVSRHHQVSLGNRTTALRHLDLTVSQCPRCAATEPTDLPERYTAPSEVTEGHLPAFQVVATIKNYGDPCNPSLSICSKTLKLFQQNGECTNYGVLYKKNSKMSGFIPFDCSNSTTHVSHSCWLYVDNGFESIWIGFSWRKRKKS